MPLDEGDPVIAPGALAAELGAVVVLDARSESAFAEAHASGAVRLPVERWERAAKTPEGALSEQGYWSTEIGRLGIDGSRPVAVLDDGRITEAARAWFILQHFGVLARVVDGGWPALVPLLREAGALEGGPGRPVEPAAFAPKPGSGFVKLVDRADLNRDLRGTAAPRVFDARTAAEHAGEDKRGNSRGGHLPRAASLPHAALLGEGNRLLPAAALRELMLKAGIAPGERVVTHCDGGGRASLAALAAVRAGYASVGNYYLSFADWAADENCPVVAG